MRAVVFDRYPEVLRLGEVERPAPKPAEVLVRVHVPTATRADYEQQDFTKNDETYDLVFDVVGEHSFRSCRRAIAPGRLYIATDGFHNVARTRQKTGNVVLSPNGSPR